MRRTTTVAFAVASVLLSGCTSASTAATQGVTWNLVTVNGATLPFATQLNGLKIEELSEQLTVLPDGTFTGTVQERRTQGATVSIQKTANSGWYTISGTTATFGVGVRGVPFTGTLIGDTLTLARAGINNVYVKQ